MQNWLTRFSRRFSPDFDHMTAQERGYWLSDAAGLLYAAPLAMLGLVWLAARTRLEPVLEHWPVFLLSTGLILLFRQLVFFLFAEIKTGLYADWGGTFDSVVAWSAALVFGPAAFWPGVLLTLNRFIRKWPSYASTNLVLPRLRHLALEIANDSLLVVLALTLYERWGGVYPLPNLQADNITRAIAVTLLWYALSSLLWAPYFFLTFLPPSGNLPKDQRRTAIRVVTRLYTTTEILPALLSPFAVLSAGMYREHGLWTYALTLSGLVLPAYLASRLSQAAERGYHRARELERLDRLSTAIINAPSDASTLPDLLQEHVPGMFPDSQVEIRLYPETILLRSSADYPPVTDAVWEWLRSLSAPEPRVFLRGEARPWSLPPDSTSVLIAPVYSLSSGKLIGGVCVVVRWWPNKIIPYFLPAVQSLAVLVSSTLHQAEVTAQMLTGERIAQELALAGEIQAGLLPLDLPKLPGWSFAAALEPSRETSGDFYDFIPLSNERLGIIIADVADKGMGAALYMTLSRTLIRSYAIEHEHHPDLVLRAVNQRLLADTHAEMFVTVFYGVLDTHSGRLDYCNAGHNPPYMLRTQTTPVGQETTSKTNSRDAGLPLGDSEHHGTGIEVESIALKNTGIALGVLEDAPLRRGSVLIEPGSTLILYTDGVTETQNEAGEFFTSDRLLNVAQSWLKSDLSGECEAEGMRNAVLDAIHTFLGEAVQTDDVAMVVVRRRGGVEALEG